MFWKLTVFRHSKKQARYECQATDGRAFHTKGKTPRNELAHGVLKKNSAYKTATE